MSTTAITPNPEFRGSACRLRMLVRREFWEHRALWIMPSVLVALVFLGTMIALAAPSRVNSHLRQEVNVEINGQSENLARVLPGFADTSFNVQLGEVTTENLLHFFSQLPESVRTRMIFLALLGQSKLLLMPMGFLVALLALNVLRQESRDRSIYFFKSMPVTEMQMIVAKTLTIIPITLILIMITLMLAHLVSMVVFSVAALVFGLNPIDLIWSAAPLFQVWSMTLQSLVVDYLMILPMVGLFFALNAWHDSRRLIAAMAVFAAAVLDKIYFSGGTLFKWLGNHMIPPGWSMRGPGGDVLTDFGMMELVQKIDWMDLGTGVILGLALLWASAHLLRWREER